MLRLVVECAQPKCGTVIDGYPPNSHSLGFTVPEHIR